MDRINDIKQWIDQYYAWLRSKTTTKNVGEWIEISTPFLDRHNDGILLYVKQDSSGKILINDDGFTIRDLEMSGYNFTKTRRMVLEKYLRYYGVQLINDELSIEADVSDFPQKKHFLLQCILAVNDMFTFSRNNTAAAYLEDVTLYLDDNDIRYTPNVQLQGHSGLSHHIDFVIPKSKNAPERILCAVSSPDVQKAKMLMFTLNDIEANRTNELGKIVILNDNKRLKDDVMTAFKNYNISAVTWSERNNKDVLDKLVA